MRKIERKNRKPIWLPSLSEIQEADEDCEGFCLACGEQQGGVEPDAANYVCESCGENAVFGAAELALRGLIA